MNLISGRDFWEGAVTMTPAAQKLHALPDITSPFASNPLELTVFVSCFNEEACIVPTLEAIAEAMEVANIRYEILIIDDGSKDRSAELVRCFMAEYPDLNMVMRINKNHKGLARNYCDGAFMGCGKYYRLVRGNNSEPVETMVDIFKSLGDADIVVPYYVTRLKKGVWQSVSMRFINGLLNVISGNQINCYTSTHMHLRYNVMRWHSDMLGSAFQIDLLCQLLALGFTCKQVPCRAVSQSSHTHAGVKKALSLMHALLNIVLRRLARGVY